jgi:hypothetical protein
MRDAPQSGARSMKLVIVVVLLVIFAGPTVAKRLSKEQPPPKRRGLAYRTVRRFGLVKTGLGTLLVLAIVPTVIWLLVIR